jgi:hypothetical protein
MRGTDQAQCAAAEVKVEIYNDYKDFLASFIKKFSDAYNLRPSSVDLATFKGSSVAGPLIFSLGKILAVWPKIRPSGNSLKTVSSAKLLLAPTRHPQGWEGGEEEVRWIKWNLKNSWKKRYKKYA